MQNEWNFNSFTKKMKVKDIDDLADVRRIDVPCKLASALQKLSN